MALSCERKELLYIKIRKKVPSGSQSLTFVSQILLYVMHCHLL